jgi:phage shock protein A
VSSVEEVKLHLGAAVSQADEARAAMRAVMQRLDTTIAGLRVTAVGTAHPTLTEAIGLLEQAQARLEEAYGLARAAMDRADAYRALI